MGKVFKVEELASGLVPEPGAHNEAAQYLASTLFRSSYDSSGVARNGITAGLIHGSTSNGTANILSDLDIVLLVDPIATDLRVVQGAISHVEDTYHVPVEATPVAIDEVVSGIHSIDYLFLTYLLEAEQNEAFNWNSPASMLHEHIATPSIYEKAKIVAEYASSKVEGFAKALTSNDLDKEAHRIQRALELPKNLGRKLLTMLDPNFHSFTISDQEMLDKIEVFLSIRNRTLPLTGSGNPAIARLSNLIQAASDYRELLEQTVGGELSLGEYQAWIDGNKRDLFTQAMLAASPIGQALVSYMREIKSYGAEQVLEV